MNRQSRSTILTQGSLPGLTPSGLGVPPLKSGLPLDILDTATRRIHELMYPHSASLPSTLHDILRDTVIGAYQRGQMEERAESVLLIESVDKINARRSERMTELAIAQCMDALSATEMMVDLSQQPTGTLAMRLDEGNRQVVHYTYTELHDAD